MSLPKYSNILVPTDGSEYSFYAASHAIYLAKACGSKVYVVNVVNAPLAFHAGIHYAESKAEMERTGREAILKIKKLCDENGVESKCLVVEGRPTDCILEAADTVKADCIVMGSIGMSNLERVLIGSVSESILWHAKCPVLLVRK